MKFLPGSDQGLHVFSDLAGDPGEQVLSTAPVIAQVMIARPDQESIIRVSPSQDWLLVHENNFSSSPRETGSSSFSPSSSALSFSALSSALSSVLLLLLFLFPLLLLLLFSSRQSGLSKTYATPTLLNNLKLKTVRQLGQ